MPDETVTLTLDGNVSLRDFATATAAFSGLLDALSQSVAPGSDLNWVVERLDSSSAVMTARADTGTEEAAERVSFAYISVGRAIESREPIPYTSEAGDYARTLANLVNGRIPSVTFENPRDTQILRHPALPSGVPSGVAAVSERLFVARGAVEGVVQTLSNRRGLRFTLYDSVFDKAVSCYLRKEQEILMRDAWGRRAIVEGTVTRDPDTGRPRAIRQITAVELVVERAPGAYRNARGISPSGPDDERPEDRIRRIRDAQ